MRHFIPLLLAFFCALNFGAALLQIAVLRRRKPWPRALGIFLLVWAALMSGLALFQMFASVDWQPATQRWLYFPLSVEMVWNLLFIQFYVLAWLLLYLALRFADRWRARKKTSAQPEAAPASTDALAISRRNFFYAVACGAAPVASVALGVHGVWTRHDLRVRHLDIAVAGLPPALEGFTIAHLSDLHSGIFCGPTRLGIIRDAANDLNADLIAITGDIINHGIEEFPAALAVIKKLRSRHGLFLCEGNHDLFPGPGVVAGACAANGLPWLYNSGYTLPLEGGRLHLAGLPWMNQGFENHPEIVERLYPARQNGDVRLLLAHHPHLFDIADGVDLVLSGHTHGGQIMAGENLGLGPLFFKYWSGPYHRGETTLVVSNGCGDWFPCRIDAPAEIGLLRLTAAKATS